MATYLSTRSFFTPTCYSRPSIVSQPSFRQLTFDPFSSRRSHSGGSHVFLVRSNLEHIEPVEAASQLIISSFPELVSRAEGLLYTIADAAVSADPAAVNTTQKTNDWLGGVTNVLEAFLKFLQDGLQTLHVPYSYGFAIILLTVLVKAATLPLTKKQVESSIAMQDLAPKVKAIQQRYKGNQERIQLETSRLYKQAGVNPLAGCLPTLATLPVWIGLYRALSNVANEGLLTEGFFWVPSLSGPTSIAARQSGTGISWLFPFVDGQPPLGWGETIAYLVLPVLLIVSQYVSMQIIQPPQSDDPSQKNTQILLKFLPLMIGYFSLSVPSGLSLYWFVNNLLSMGQQVWLRKLGGASTKDAGDIITAGQALRTSSAPVIDRKERRGEKFKQLKAEKPSKKDEQVEASDKSANLPAAISAGTNSDTSDEDGTIDISAAKDSLEEMYSKSGAATTKRRSKRSKRKRSL